ncbi:GspE/PulE family protein [Photobacterium indicum]|uniref:GspE/PulE family protein n=1 Tax=Photobacterium indicum TaxID=81447 RepID=UPI003D0EFEB9
MNNESELLLLLTDKTLTQLCLDDGYTFVTRDGGVHTCNALAPHLDTIIRHVKGMKMMVGKTVEIHTTSPTTVETMIEIMTQSSISQDAQNTEKTTALGNQLATLCQAAVDINASDIHLEVYRETTRFLVRVDGDREILTRFSDGKSASHQPRHVGISLMSYIFGTLGEQDAKLRDPANDRFEIAIPWKGKVKVFEWRAALIPINKGVKLTLRCLTQRDKALTLDDMDLPPPYIDLLLLMINKRNGAIVITGPMGSGKSSLMYALTETIDRVARSCHSLEDPVEFEQDFVCKTTVEPNKETVQGSKVYRDYAFYSKETLRHDVDVSQTGECRDYATAKEYCRKGETGGLALTSLHTNSAMGVPQTFIQQLGIPASVVGSPDLMLMFVHQRLIKKLCQECALPLNDDATRTLYEAAGREQEYATKRQQLHTLFTPDQQTALRVAHPQGCEHCQSRGEKGRLVVMEIIVLEDADRAFIANEETHKWKAHLKAAGWPDIRDHTLSRIRRGQLDITAAAKHIDGLLPNHAQNHYTAMRDAL